MKVMLGSNVIENCAAVLVVNGEEVFRLRKRTGDGRLVCDFDIRNEAGERLANIARNNVVYAAKGYDEKNLPRESFVSDPEGNIVARIEEVAHNTIKIAGDFWIGSHNVVITDQTLVSGGITMSGNFISGFGKAISIDQLWWI